MPRTVLFPASTPLSYAVFGPLARGLAADPRVAIFVTARHGGARLARECLDVPFRYVPNPIAPFRRFDLAVASGFYFRPRRRMLQVQIFHGVSPKNYAVRDEVRRFDRLFLIGEYHRRKFVRAGLLGEEDPRGLRIGMPKTDRLVHPDAVTLAFIRDLHLEPLPTVVYAPTRSGSAGSSLDGKGLAMVDRLLEMPVNVLVKLHDRSSRRFRSRLAVDFEAELSRRESHPRLRFIRHHDVIPSLVAADLLVSDLSSVTGEYLLRDRPIVYLAVPGHEEKVRRGSGQRFGADDPEDLDYLRAAGEVVDTPAALARAVERGLADPAARGPERRERAARLFYHPGAATPRALAALRHVLGLEDG